MIKTILKINEIEKLEKNIKDFVKKEFNKDIKTSFHGMFLKIHTSEEL
jgi:hypothetical protein